MVLLARPHSCRTCSPYFDRVRLPSLISVILTIFAWGLILFYPVLALGNNGSVALEPVTIGITFAGSYSSVIYNVNGSFTFIHDNQNNTSVPTCVAFSEIGESFIGQSARDLLQIQPQRAICNLEDILRNRKDNTAAQTDGVFDDIVHPTVKILSDDQFKMYKPEELVRIFFQGLKNMTEDFTGQKVSNVVVSVSSTTTYSEKDTLKRVLEDTDFETVHVVYDAVLAGLAYDMDEIYESDDQGTFALMYSIGESSIEFGVIKIEEGMFEVLSTSEDKSINANVLHSELVKYLRELYPELKDVTTSLLDKEIEKVRRVLFSEDTAYFTAVPTHAGQEFQRTVARENFNHVLAPYITRIVSQLKQVIHNANLTIYDISEIIPIGVADTFPAVQTHLARHFPSMIEIRNSISPQSVIAYGLSKVLSSFQDPIVGNYETSSQSLGIRTAGGLATPIVHRISILPAERTRVFTTVKDNQKLAVIEMFEGDRVMVDDNTILARIEVGDIPPVRRGVPRIEVTIKYLDYAAGQYMITVRLEGRDGEQSITGNLPLRSYKEMKTLLDNLDNTAEEDQIIRAKLEARLAEGDVFTEDADIVEVGKIWWNERED